MIFLIDFILQIPAYLSVVVKVICVSALNFMLPVLGVVGIVSGHGNLVEDYILRIEDLIISLNSS